MLYVRNIRLPLTAPVAQAQARALHTLGIRASQAARCEVARLSVDARRGHPVLVYTIAVTLKDEGAEPVILQDALGESVSLQEPHGGGFALRCEQNEGIDEVGEPGRRKGVQEIVQGAFFRRESEKQRRARESRKKEDIEADEQRRARMPDLFKEAAKKFFHRCALPSLSVFLYPFA